MSVSLATEYRTVLPDEQLIAAEIEKTRRHLEALRKINPQSRPTFLPRKMFRSGRAIGTHEEYNRFRF